MASKTMYEKEKEITDKIGAKEAIEMFENLLLTENYKPVALNHCRRLAIKALKKQIPKKPKGVYDENESQKGNPLYDEALIGNCPFCNFEVQNGMCNCMNCGQALDWSGINE